MTLAEIKERLDWSARNDVVLPLDSTESALLLDAIEERDELVAAIPIVTDGRFDAVTAVERARMWREEEREA